MLACDPHLKKAAQTHFYLTRLTWNETQIGEEGEQEYKTYLIGASLVGVPQFLYARTPKASWGVTALFPDTMDLFVEDVHQDSYLDSVS